MFLHHVFLPAFIYAALSEWGMGLPTLSLFLSSEGNRYGGKNSIWTYLHCLYLFLQVERDGGFHALRTFLWSVTILTGKWQRIIKTQLKWL